MRLKRKKKTNYFIIFLIIFIVTRIMLKDIGSKLAYHIENIVIKNVNKSVYNNVFSILGSDELGSEELLDVISLSKNNDGEVISVDYNMNIAYDVLSNCMEDLYSSITSLDMSSLYKSGINNVYYIPMGLIYNNVLIDNLGFRIPCKINFISDIDMGFKTRVKDYGVNNLLIEIYLVIDIKNYIMSPSTYKEFGETYEILVASKIVLGRIPMYYGGIMEKSSSIVSS
ncbi:MAG: sporulation protein YunB [Bacilli bacterium]|nr:sporulation protein YunB [Bacilli bacterium]